MKQENLHSGHRARMIQSVLKSPDSLAEHQLLEVLLYPVILRKDTNLLAHELLHMFGSLSRIFSASAEELKAIKGIGDSVASYLLVVGKIYYAVGQNEKKEKKCMFSIDRLKDEIDSYFHNLKQEDFLIFLLDEKYKILTTITFTDMKQGLVCTNIREIARLLAINKPAFVVASHNHLSGIPYPSKEDDIATRKLNMLCSVQGVQLADHIIYTVNGTFSYFGTHLLEKIKKETDLDTLTQSALNKEFIYE